MAPAGSGAGEPARVTGPLPDGQVGRARAMYLDVVELRNFYYRSGLGRVAQRAIRDQLLQLWPAAEGETVVGFGFAAPLLRPYLGQARRVVSLMPAAQGVMSWPAGLPNVSVLSDETGWPVPTGSADRIVVMHALEMTDRPTDLLEECWRALAPQGRVVFVVPNRSGLWARGEGTPFGYGRPYSLSQLESQLRRAAFVPERHVAALYAPPSRRRFWLRTSPFWEGSGRRLSSLVAGGVHMVEATKQVYAPRQGGLGALVARPRRVLDGVAGGVVEPV